jgi:hypothetical protein
MTILILGAAAFFLITFLLHLTSIIIATKRCRTDRRYEIPPLDAPAVSLVRPVCGTENYCDGWHSPSRTPLVWVLRDLLLPVLWIQAWLGSTFAWRGNHMHVARPQTAG